MNNTNQNIYPKPCVYNCGVQIFWNTATSEYWEVFTKKKHICPNRVNNKPVTTNNISAGAGQQQLILNPHIIAKNPGIHNQNQRCLTHLNYCRVQ